MSSLDRIRASIDAEIAGCAERVRDLLAEAGGLSEREVMAAGDCVAAVKAEARSNVEALEAVARVLESRDGGAGDGLASAIKAQSQNVHALVTRIRSGQDVQRKNTAEVVAIAHRINSFVGTIGKIASALQMLTLNARIEAARQRAQGSAFATIADAMRSLASDVERANQGIGELSEELTGSAEKAEANDLQMQALLSAAEAEMGTELIRLLTTFEEAQSTSATAARCGMMRAERVATLTDDILSRLQFQDRMAQILAEANRNIHRAAAFTREVLAGADGEDHERLLDDVRAKIGDSTVRLSRESELSSSDLDMESGVVNLF